MPKPIRKYPVVRDRIDDRDFKLAPHGAGLAITPEYDNSHFLGPVLDQGVGNTCTAFSWSSVREFLYRKHYLWETNRQIPPSKFLVSPQFLYYMERVLEGDIDQNQGADSRTGAKVLAKYGACLSTEDPYQPSQWAVEPTDQQLKEALLYRAGPYNSIPDVLSLKSVIYSGYVASIGVAVYQSFQSDQAAATGNIPVPGGDEQYLGGHEVTPYRYDDAHVNWDGSLGAIGFLNSWGIEWGVKVGPTRVEPGGAGWFPYSYFTSDMDLVLNMWTLRLSNS